MTADPKAGRKFFDGMTKTVDKQTEINYNLLMNRMDAPLAKLDIASVYGTEGQEFESLTVRHTFKRPQI